MIPENVQKMLNNYITNPEFSKNKLHFDFNDKIV